MILCVYTECGCIESLAKGAKDDKCKTIIFHIYKAYLYGNEYMYIQDNRRHENAFSHAPIFSPLYTHIRTRSCESEILEQQRWSSASEMNKEAEQKTPNTS